MKADRIVVSALALLASSLAVPALCAGEASCDDPKQILVVQPLNPTGRFTSDGNEPPAVIADGPSAKETYFKFAVAAVTYGPNGAVAHGCDRAKGGCAGDIGSVLGSIRWQGVVLPGLLPSAAGAAAGRLLSTAPVCVPAARLVPGPPISVDVRGPAARPTELPPLTVVQSALIAIPAGVLSPSQAGVVGAVKLASWAPGAGDCPAGAAPLAQSVYTPATAMTAYDAKLACTISHGPPAATLFVRNAAALLP